MSCMSTTREKPCSWVGEWAEERGWVVCHFPYVTATYKIYLSWLYALFLGIDTNFWLRHQDVSSDKVDPDLNQGCAYFVEEKEYKEYPGVHNDDLVPVSHHMQNNTLVSDSVSSFRSVFAHIMMLSIWQENIQRAMQQVGLEQLNVYNIIWSILMQSAICSKENGNSCLALFGYAIELVKVWSDIPTWTTCSIRASVNQSS